MRPSQESAVSLPLGTWGIRTKAKSARRPGRALLFAAVAALALGAVQAAPAWAAGKTVVRTQNDLPRYNYPVAGTASELLTSDDATFNAFAAKVQADVDSLLAKYDIQDRGTLRGILSVRLSLQVLSGTQDQAALDTMAQIKALEDKPDAKLLSNARLMAFVKARMATGQSSGPAFEKTFSDNLTAELGPLPWAVVGNRLKEMNSSTQIGSTALLYLGEVQATIEPALAPDARARQPRTSAWPPGWCNCGCP